MLSLAHLLFVMMLCLVKKPVCTYAFEYTVGRRATFKNGDPATSSSVNNAGQLDNIPYLDRRS